jgi:hypothetical protein
MGIGQGELWAIRIVAVPKYFLGGMPRHPQTPGQDVEPYVQVVVRLGEETKQNIPNECK